ncbi:MAG: DNA translocase FtsK [Candidatus Ozemobacteraceae bacterium]
MSTKRILLPEPPVRERAKSGKKTKTEPSYAAQKSRAGKRQRDNKCVVLVTDNRQRNEAIGLIMIGCSAFSLSLLHYVSSSQGSAIVQSAMVNLGIGVYIIPCLVGMLGIQKFMERPFKNLGWRIAGCIGAVVSGLGLLGVEGGKLGGYTFSALASHFGSVPTYLLLATALASSLIFALDILYKDILAGTLIVAGLSTRFVMFVWEVLLSLIAMTIGAVKTTGDFFGAIINRIAQTYKTSETDDTNKGAPSTLSNLLSFRLKKHENQEKPELNEEAEREEVDQPSNREQNDIHSVIDHVEAEEATIIPVPAEPVSVAIAPATEVCVSGVSVQVSQFTAMTNLETSVKSEIATTTPPPHPVESNDEEECVDYKIEVNFDDECDDEEDDLEIIETSQDETGTVTNKTPTVNLNIVKTEKLTDPVYLEDNPIDREIKIQELNKNNDNQVKEKFIAKLPTPAEILNLPKQKNNTDIKADLENRSKELLKTLADFGLKAAITDVVYGPAISRFELKPAPGVKVSKITGLSDDIALALSAQSIRIEAPIPGKPAIGIEIPNKEPTPVYFYDLIQNDKFIKSPVMLNIALGQTINGQAVYADLADMPHLLIAGSTGSGKSVCVNTIIASILFKATADQVKFIMIDPKMVELSSYNGIPHLISPVVTDPQKAGDALLWAQEEMTRRYTVLAECGCKKLQTYNESLDNLREEIDPNLEPMPLIVVVIDELADLMMTAKDKVETTICRLAQMARAVGIHLIIATQRPSVDVLTGLIKANLPTRIAFSVASAVDSKTILDSKGAEKLIGKGDMLFIPKGRNKPLRVQGAFVSDAELKKLVDFVKQQGKPEYVDIAPMQSDDDEDDNEDFREDSVADSDSELINRIVNYLEAQEKTSTSMLQRKFRIGYNRAARIMDQLEEKGMVTPTDGSNKRRVLIGRSIAQL